MKKIFSPSPLWQKEGIAIIRIVTGAFLIYHGWDSFDAKKMAEYAAWDMFKNSSSASFMVYMGKATELITGFLLAAGLLTRLTSVIVMGTFTYIAFFVGHGQIWYEDQHPFLFVLLAFVFFFSGPGKWSFDQLIFRKVTKRAHKV